MNNSHDALLYAAATIVSGQIAGNAIKNDLADEKNVAAAVAAALRAVEAGIKQWEDDKARHEAANRTAPPDLEAVAQKLRARGARKQDA